MHSTTRSFKKDLSKYLNDSILRRNVAKATEISLKKREKVVAEIPNWEALREEAHRIKRQIIDNLAENLEKFERNAKQQGIEVLRAKDAKAANRFAEQIAAEHQVRRIVKSKSMLTEEIDFNESMQKKGFDVIETDLGEYIIQLAGEPPSHLTGPAIHKSVQEIARLFAEKLGVPYSEDPLQLTKTARRILREKFLTAEMGVTGANFGIVENGSITVVENEGNARLCMSLPRVHIAFIGIERLIPTTDDLDLFLKLLCRSSTGQKLTSFISTISGPKSSHEYDGPDKVYYILVDNGRSSFLEDEHLKEALYCIRCGACYNTCPIYQNIGGHAYGWVYQGPIGAVITPQFLGLEEAKSLPFASSLCGSCTDICPVKIPLHHLLLYQRNRIVQYHLNSKVEKVAFKGFTSVNRSAKKFLKLAKWGGGLQRIIKVGYVPGWSVSREFPPIAKQSFREWWKKSHVK